MTVLVASGITRRYAGFNALDNVDFSLQPGERHALIGPNGAGKSTLFDILGGQREPSAGSIRFDGEDITARPAWWRARRGLARTFQRNNLCMHLSVFENVRLAVQGLDGAQRDLLHHRRHHTRISEAAQQVLDSVTLSPLAGRLAAELSYGDQRKLEIAMALAGKPRILMVDEPTAGMSKGETAEMVEVLRKLPAELSLLIVEHDMDVVATLADTATVLQNGRVIAQGLWREIRDSEVVSRAYTGTKRLGGHA